MAQRIKKVKREADCYTFEDGSVMQREMETLTPNGNKLSGR